MGVKRDFRGTFMYLSQHSLSQTRYLERLSMLYTIRHENASREINASILRPREGEEIEALCDCFHL